MTGWTVRSGSTRARVARTPPTRPTSARCRSAWCVPRTVEAAAEAVAVCREHDVPVLSRGGGTSLAGQCTNTAVVLDWSKYCHRAVSRRCRSSAPASSSRASSSTYLNEQLAPHGLRFGPEPATHLNCTLGGMIGNNSCGATAQRTGKVVDNIAALEVLLYDGTRFWCGADQRRGVRADRAARRPARRDLPRAAPAARRARRPDPGALPGHPAPGLRLQPRLAAARARLRHRRAAGRQRVHAGHRAARRAQAGPGACQSAALVVLGYPEHRHGRRRGARHRRSTSRSRSRASTTT